MYVLHCERCGHEYGANGSDLWLRRCPACDGGAKGFEVTAADVIEMPEAEAARRNPPWTRDELILALELYLRNPAFPPGKTSREIAELSMVLNSLSEGGEGEHDAAFRNANGVYMKLMNFRRFDPAYQTAGKVGLTRGNRIEGEVWGEFADDVARLQAVAAGIRRAITVAPPEVAAIDLSEIAEAVEGRLLTRLHLYRERDRELVKRRKQRAMRETGKLVCEGCEFDFEATYGERGRGVIECHHVKAIETLAQEGQRVTEDDLALLCSNCHRMVHARRPWLSIEDLREALESRHSDTHSQR